MKTYVVKFTESERGWGGEVWYNRYSSEVEALKAVEDCNKDLPDQAPDYYIIADYIGVDERNDPRYDMNYKF